jgi:hypothetical protein
VLKVLIIPAMAATMSVSPSAMNVWVRFMVVILSWRQGGWPAP